MIETGLSAANLAEFLGRSAASFPDRTAVVDTANGRTLTYAELDDRASRIAGFLRSQGVPSGARVGLLMAKSADCVSALFGILRAGAAYVPVDRTAPAARIRAVFSDCRVDAVFADADACGVLADDPPRVLVPVGGTSWEDALTHSPVGDAPHDADALAYILYTSGSTGVPKGVALSHRNAIGFVDWCSSVFRPVETDRFSSHAPFHFDLSVLDIYLAVKHGAALYLVREDLGKSPKELAPFIAANRLSVWYSTPSILSLLVEFGNLRQHDFSALRLVLFAGEVFPVKHLRNLMKLWPSPAYYNLYGPTETNVCTFARIPPQIPDDRSEPFPIGPACSHCEALVLGKDGQEVAEGEEGLLYIAGPSVFQGYWNRPAENAAAFLDREGRRWYNTGDVVRHDRDEGYIYVGRRDRMVKRRGYRIELGEIESGLYRHPGIREAAAVASSDAAGVRIVACVAPHGEQPSIIALKEHCAKALPAYMSPDAFVFMERLPRTSTNKVDYQQLSAALERKAAQRA